MQHVAASLTVLIYAPQCKCSRHFKWCGTCGAAVLVMISCCLYRNITAIMQMEDRWKVGMQQVIYIGTQRFTLQQHSKLACALCTKLYSNKNAEKWQKKMHCYSAISVWAFGPYFAEVICVNCLRHRCLLLRRSWSCAGTWSCSYERSVMFYHVKKVNDILSCSARQCIDLGAV